MSKCLLRNVDIKDEIEIKDEPTEPFEDPLSIGQTLDNESCDDDDDVKGESLKKEKKDVFPTTIPSSSYCVKVKTDLSETSVEKVKIEKNQDTSSQEDNVNEIYFVESENEVIIKKNSKSRLKYKKKVPKVFKCSECNYETIKKFNLKTHAVCHSDVKQYQCAECNFETKHKIALKRHLLTHSDTKLFKCTECDYETNQKRDLKVHLLNHSDSKMFQCSECHYETNRKWALQSHMKVHYSTDIFKCSQCNYETNRKYCLKLHSEKHVIR